MHNIRPDMLVDESTGQEYFHPVTGRAPYAKRIEPASDRLYQLKDVKEDTIRKITMEQLKETLSSMKLTINKDSIIMAEKAVSKAIDDILCIIDPNNSNIFTALSAKCIFINSATN